MAEKTAVSPEAAAHRKLLEKLESLENEVQGLRESLYPKRNRYVSIAQNAQVAWSVNLMATPDGPIKIGVGTRILRGAEILGAVTIGERCFINRDAYIRANTTIGNDVAIGPFCRFVTDSHEIGDTTRRAGTNTTAPISIGDGTWLGASVTVLGGVAIGRGCVVAAGSVVTKYLPDNTLAAGIPARVIRALDEPPKTPGLWVKLVGKLPFATTRPPRTS